MKLINEKKFAETIADLLVESEDPENPNPEHNAYNWGLINAQMVLQGIPLDVIKASTPR